MSGEDLKRIRLEVGLTQSELAARSGLCQPVIARLERGANHNIKLSTLQKIAEGLGRELRLSLV